MSAQVRDKDIRFVENKKKEAEFSPSTGMLLLGVERVIGTFLAMAIYYKGAFFNILFTLLTILGNTVAYDLAINHLGDRGYVYLSLYVLNLVLGLMGLNVSAQRYAADVGAPDQHVYKVYFIS